jgi:sulfite exporter TauE/SafE
MGEKGQTISFVKKLLQRSASTIMGLPDEISRVLQQVQKGEFEFQSSDIRSAAKLLYSAFHQLAFMLLGLSAGGVGWLLHSAGDTSLSQVAFGFAGFFLLLMFRAMRWGKRVLKGMS